MAEQRIGVLLVHGIGTNTPNQFLVDQTRKIVAAMGEQVAAISVLHEPPVGDKVPDHYVVDYKANRVQVEVKTKASRTEAARTLHIDFNEVYWADLGEKPTLVNQVKFWFWALSMWALAARDYTRLPGFSGMYKPKGDHLKSWDRLFLAVYGLLFGLGAATVGLLNIIADRVKLPRVPISDILTAYVGDVMLYSQTSGDDDPTVADMAQPPRVGIRARMVDALVEIAQGDYDRWYVFAHSQGTVVAYNGLMETAAALPNYLTQARWDSVATRLKTKLPDRVPALMLPRRPVWLGDRDGIDRDKLFSRLQGFLTYGSAIGKFHAIWPIIVPANAQEEVFPENFYWINVFDPTDPVSGPLDAYTREYGYNAQCQPIDGHRAKSGRVSANIDRSIPYKSGPLWLLSHLQYLNYYSPGYQRQEPLLVSETARWLVDGVFDPKHTLEAAKPSVRWRTLLAGTQVAIATLIVWLSTAALLWEIFGSRRFDWLGHMAWPVGAAGAFALAVAFNFGLQHLRKRRRHDLSTGLRWVVVIVAVGGTAAAARYFQWIGRAIDHELSGIADGLAHWLRSLPGLMGNAANWIIGLLNHPDALRMSVGLLSLAIILIVLFGWIRWLVQPLPVQKEEHGHGMKPW
jgi:hypothetical protein